jgi:hypothetical protein
LDDVLGLALLLVYIVGIVGLAAAITFAVIKIFPTERNPKKDDKDGDGSPPTSSTDGAGKLFRRSKRAAT